MRQLKTLRLEEIADSSEEAFDLLVVLFDRNLVRLAKTTKVALKSKMPSDRIVVICPRRRLKSLALKLVLGSLRNDITVVYSAEPYRSGLNISRICRISAGDIWILGTQSAKNHVQQIREIAEHNPDVAIIGVRSHQNFCNLPFRLATETILLKRFGLMLIGDLDESFIPIQDFVDDLCGRLIAQCLPIATIPGTPTTANPPQESERVEALYPWMSEVRRTFRPINVVPFENPQIDASAPQAPTQFRVLLDGRGISNIANGTGQLFLRATIALRGDPQFQIAALVDSNGNEAISQSLGDLGVNCIFDSMAPARDFDVGFRPYQFQDPVEVSALRQRASKVVVAHLDFIALTNPTYHLSPPIWLESSKSALAALQQVDGIAWLSPTVARQAKTILPQINSVPNRVCGAIFRFPFETIPTSQKSPWDRPYLLTIGSAYSHKNRLYSIRLLKALIERSWNGDLIFIGWEPPFGSSRQQEKRFLIANPILLDRVHYLPPQENGDLEKFVEGSYAVVHPSVSEGFGMIPFEAALLGTPTFLARHQSLRDLIPKGSIPEMTFSEHLDAQTLLSYSIPEVRDSVCSTLANLAMRHDDKQYVHNLKILLSAVLES